MQDRTKSIKNTYHNYCIYTLDLTEKNSVNKNTKYAISKLISYFGEDYSIYNFNPAKVSEFTNHIRKQHTEQTVGLIMNYCKCFFDYLVAKEGVLSNYFVKSVKSVSTQQNVIKPLSDEELDSVVHYIKKTDNTKNIGLSCLLRVFLDTGMRACEVQNLKFGDIISDRIHVRKGKKNKSRIITVDNNLKYRIRFYKYSLLEKGHAIDENSYIFFSGFFALKRSHVDYYSKTSTRYMRLLISRNIQKNIKLHSFRASYASRHFENGLDAALIQKLMGHTNINQTLSYIGEKIKNDAITDYFKGYISITEHKKGPIGVSVKEHKHISKQEEQPFRQQIC